MICLHCGQDEHAEVLEVYADGTFTLDTCCEGMHEAAAEFLAEDPRAAARWLGRALQFDHLGLGKLRRVIDADGQMLLDWNLAIDDSVPWGRAKAFIAEHHRHCEAPAGWRFGAAVRNGAQLLGVITVGRAVARAYDPKKVVEVNRNCIRTDVPSDLVWNACSMAYGWAAREAERRGFEKIITYTLQTEDGTTLRAAGWTLEASLPARKKGWRDAKPIAAKYRWSKTLRPRPQRRPPAPRAPACPPSH